MSNKRWMYILVGIVVAVGVISLYRGDAFTFWNSQKVSGTVSMEQTATANKDETTDLSDEELLEKFANAMSIIQEQYVNEVDQTDLLEGAIKGMIDTLEDPYSDYMDLETAKQFEESLSSHFEGIGAEVSMQDGKVTIVAPFKDSPAEKAGLQPNDQIVKIDGNKIEGLSLYEAVLQIRGEKGTEVLLTVERQGLSETLEIKVIRDEIPLETVSSESIERNGQKIGLIEISSFSEDTAERFEKALNQLEAQQIDGLIIDVRGNPGGYLQSVEDIGSLVIPGGKPIVQIEDRNGEKMRYVSSLKETKPYPIVGLTDGASASASEILAGALIEAGDYEVVGETTFGKGTVQQTIPMGDGSQIKLSLFRWLTSAGNNIHGEGVEPTVTVRQPDYFYVTPITVEDPLVEDMMNEQIKSAQTMLVGLGYELNRVDGYFDQETKEAVRSFQQSNQLEETGEIDEATAVEMVQQIIDLVQDQANDRQLQKAIELLTN